MAIAIFTDSYVEDVDGEHGNARRGIFTNEGGWSEDKNDYEKRYPDDINEEWLLNRLTPPGQYAVQYDSPDDVPAVHAIIPDDYIPPTQSMFENE